MDIKVNMKFQCKNCNEIINHNYTQQDLLNHKTKEEAIKEIKKNFKTR